MTIVSEPGLYRLMMRSDAPAAEPFQVWISEEVLPQIRRTGRYAVPVAPALPPPAASPRPPKGDREVAARRSEVSDLNRQIADAAYANGTGVRGAISCHVAVSLGMFGATPAEIREFCDWKPGDTPLNHMAALPLSQVAHAKLLAAKYIAEAGIAPGEAPAVYGEIARKIVERDKAMLPGPHAFMVVDHPTRGPVIDLIPDVPRRLSKEMLRERARAADAGLPWR